MNGYLLIVRGSGPHSFEQVNAGAAWDFSITGEDWFPDETIQASTWTPISGCTIAAVSISDTVTKDGIEYSNVVTARISGFNPDVEAVTELTLIGDVTGQSFPFQITIPVAP